MLILIVDDDVDNSQLMATFLEQTGHQVLRAFTAEEGMEALTRVLEQGAGQIASEDLRAVVQLQEPGHDRHGNDDQGLPRRLVGFVKPVDCSRVSGLARDELARRGLTV